MRINVKPGVVVKEFNNALLKMLEAIDKIFLVLGHVPTITSVNDGTHMQNSKHYTNEAVDLRTRDLPVTSLPKLCNDLKRVLGPDYDVVLEADHLHIERDV